MPEPSPRPDLADRIVREVRRRASEAYREMKEAAIRELAWLLLRAGASIVCSEDERCVIVYRSIPVKPKELAEAMKKLMEEILSK